MDSRNCTISVYLEENEIGVGVVDLLHVGQGLKRLDDAIPFL